MGLEAFCDPTTAENCKFNLSKPANHGGWEYCTNGYIAVRKPTTLPDDDVNAREFPKVWDCFQDFPTCDRDWPVLEMKNEKCDRCDGSGRDEKRCPDCDGSGDCVCSYCEDQHDCGTCKGSGSIEGDGPCPVCNGETTVEVLADTMFGPALFGGKFLQTIMQEFTGLKWAEPATDEKPLAFTCGDVQGLLMPLSVR
jgi:hypothetical protein